MSFKINNEPVNITMFSDNTSQVWKLPAQLFDVMRINIEWNFQHEGELMHLAQMVELFKQNGTPKINLYLPYLPYARQDKEVSNTSTFALSTFAKILNSLDLNLIYFKDAHSRVATMLIKNSHSIAPQLDTVIETSKADILCFPDYGAAARYSNDYPFVALSKIRDQQSGNITHMYLEEPGTVRVKGKRVIIIDDICDGGMTFKMASDVLLKNGATNVDLYVSHGIFSKGLRTLKDSGINRIFTINGEASEVQGMIAYKEIQ